MALTAAQRRIREKTSATYKATLKDEGDDVIPLSSVTTITLTLYDKRSGSVINSRSAQNVKNTNNVTIHVTSGLLTWEMQPTDNVIVNSGIPVGDVEEHIALFEWVSGSKSGKHEVQFDVIQTEKVT